MTFDAIAGYVDHSTVSTREIYAFPTTLSILRQYAHKALCIKTPLSRGETGKTFTDTENNSLRAGSLDRQGRWSRNREPAKPARTMGRGKPARELLIFEFPAFADERSDPIG